MVICIECKKEFEMTSTNKLRHPHQKYCSPKCSKRRYYLNNKKQWENSYDPEKNKIRCRIYYNKNKEILLQKNKEHYQKNKERIQKQHKIYEKTHHRHLMNIKVARKRERYKTDIQFQLREKLRARIRGAFRDLTTTGKIRNCEDYGIDMESLLNKLQETLPANYSEESYHIDHIIPLKSFNLENPEEIKKAFSAENTQWLTEKENLHKGAKVIYV